MYFWSLNSDFSIVFCKSFCICYCSLNGNINCFVSWFIAGQCIWRSLLSIIASCQLTQISGFLRSLKNWSMSEETKHALLRICHVTGPRTDSQTFCHTTTRALSCSLSMMRRARTTSMQTTCLLVLHYFLFHLKIRLFAYFYLNFELKQTIANVGVI